MSTPPLPSTCLQVTALTHAYGERSIVEDITFSLSSGQIGCLLGPSGCGKTTLLRCLAGFETPRTGAIFLNGREIFGPDRNIPPQQRGIGMVFQDYALFPHLNIADNIGFGLHKQPKPARQARVVELLQLIGLESLGKRYPHQLSGGQQQRVALARALAPKPTLLLMDEPFSNLDVDLRKRLGEDIRRLLKHEGMTAILVTHDQEEAFAIADEIGIVHQGHIAQWATPYELYHKPSNRFVADFIGEGTLVPGKALHPDWIEIELGEVRGKTPADCGAGCNLDVLIRPDDIQHDDASPLQAKVLHKTFRGAEFLYTLELASGTQVLSLVPSHHDHAIGESIGIRLQIEHVITFCRSH